jgi:hypothetical protein
VITSDGHIGDTALLFRSVYVGAGQAAAYTPFVMGTLFTGKSAAGTGVGKATYGCRSLMSRSGYDGGVYGSHSCVIVSMNDSVAELPPPTTLHAMLNRKLMPLMFASGADMVISPVYSLINGKIEVV